MSHDWVISHIVLIWGYRNIYILYNFWGLYSWSGRPTLWKQTPSQAQANSQPCPALHFVCPRTAIRMPANQHFHCSNVTKCPLQCTDRCFKLQYKTINKYLFRLKIIHTSNLTAQQRRYAVSMAINLFNVGYEASNGRQGGYCIVAVKSQSLQQRELVHARLYLSYFWPGREGTVSCQRHTYLSFRIKKVKHSITYII